MGASHPKNQLPAVVGDDAIHHVGMGRQMLDFLDLKRVALEDQPGQRQESACFGCYSVWVH